MSLDCSSCSLPIWDWRSLVTSMTMTALTLGGSCTVSVLPLLSARDVVAGISRQARATTAAARIDVVVLFRMVFSVGTAVAVGPIAKLDSFQHRAEAGIGHGQAVPVDLVLRVDQVT